MNVATAAGYGRFGGYGSGNFDCSRFRGIARALDLPGYRLHRLKGDLKGFWSVTVRANWRIVFRFDGNHTVDVDFVDYH